MNFGLVKSITVIFICLLWPGLHSQQNDKREDYAVIFGHDYENALKIINEHPQWSDSLLTNGFDPGFSLAVIFPELIRYSSISDYLETKALEVLYVQYGKDYADFSIGLFQLKPSFAEQIERDIINFNLVAKYPFLSALNPDTADTPEIRRERVIRLKEGHDQLVYLEAFIRIMDIRYPEWSGKPVREKLTFYATAFNSGYYNEKGSILQKIDESYFYCGWIATGEKYNYAKIAVDYCCPVTP